MIDDYFAEFMRNQRLKICYHFWHQIAVDLYPIGF